MAQRLATAHAARSGSFRARAMETVAAGTICLCALERRVRDFVFAAVLVPGHWARNRASTAGRGNSLRKACLAWRLACEFGGEPIPGDHSGPGAHWSSAFARACAGRVRAIRCRIPVDIGLVERELSRWLADKLQPKRSGALVGRVGSAHSGNCERDCCGGIAVQLGDPGELIFSPHMAGRFLCQPGFVAERELAPGGSSADAGSDFLCRCDSQLCIGPFGFDSAGSGCRSTYYYRVVLSHGEHFSISTPPGDCFGKRKPLPTRAGGAD